MNARTSTKQRQSIRQKRCPPSPIWCRRIPADSPGDLEPAEDRSYLELILEATDADGAPAPWFDDFWWVDALTLYKEKTVTIHLAPTPGAAWNPTVLHQTEMLRRLEPTWRAIAYVYRDDLADDDTALLLASSAYHEVRVIDADRPVTLTVNTSPNDGLTAQVRIDRLERGIDAAVVRRPRFLAVPPDDPTLHTVLPVAAGPPV